MKSNDTVKGFLCLCGKSFNSMSDLQKHIDEVSDATDFKIHGIASVPSSTTRYDTINNMD